VTEMEWLACADPGPMLEFLRGSASDRKLRLFACACCRAVWDSLAPQRSRRAVETAEEYADGLATEHDLHRVRSMAGAAAADYQARLLRSRLVNRDLPTREEGRLFFAAEAAHAHTPFLIGRLRWLRWDAELNTLSPRLLRDLFGNPLRPATLDPAWRTPDVLSLAQGAYDNRALPAGALEAARLAVLADALEDAGCTNADLLGHLRGEGPHVRGCWCVDLVLGKG
jgi:hypothetical protein